MNDLKQLAAKAAGIEHGADRLYCGVSLTLTDGRHKSLPRWNPLTDDGDALRLAVTLKLQVACGTFRDGEIAAYSFGQPATVERSDDPFAAARRAIVLAAAEIQRAKERSPRLSVD